MAEFLGYFVGASMAGGRVIEGDSWELILMGQKALGEGWRLFPNLADTLDSIRTEKPLQVKIAGGLAGVCVARATREALENGAIAVRIDLRNIRISPEDDGRRNEDGETLKIRKTHLLAGMGRMAEDSRLEIVGLH